MKFTGYYDITGNKIYVGDYLKYSLLDEVEGYVEKINGEYMFGGGFELKNYGADVKKVILEK